MPITPNKKNLFKFFKSNEFNEARLLLCADYIILSYSNELQERINTLLQGYNGLFIGSLKKASIEARRALENYDKEYISNINKGGELQLGDTSVDVTSQLDETIEKNKFFFQQCYNIIANVLNKEIEEKVRDDEQIEKEASEDFQIISPKAVEQAVEAAVIQARHHKNYQLIECKKDFEEGLKIGFRACMDLINAEYLKA